MAGRLLRLMPADAAQDDLRRLGRVLSRPQAARPPAANADRALLRRDSAQSTLRIGDFDISESEDEALERFCKPLAERFVVSPIAMRIRLEKLGLLHRVVPLQRLLASK